jgi:hypothetical protein
MTAPSLSASTRSTRRLRAAFYPLFHALAQGHGFRTYLAGLPAPRDWAKTLAHIGAVSA